MTRFRDDGAHPGLRAAGRGALPRRRDPRLRPHLARAGGGRGRRLRRTARRRLHNDHPSRAWPLPRQGRRRRRDDGRAVRAGRRAVRRQGRVDAHRRSRRSGSSARTRSSAPGIPLARRRRALRASCWDRAESRSPSSARARSTRAPSTRPLNLAAIWDLPVIFVCENNGYAEFTDSRTNVPGARAWPSDARAYGVAAETVDGNDVEAVVRGDAGRRRACRSGDGPGPVEAQTYRWHGHYEGDAQPYKPEEEAPQWRERDPLVARGRALVAGGTPRTATTRRGVERRRAACRRRRRARARRADPRDPRRLSHMSSATERRAPLPRRDQRAACADAMERRRPRRPASGSTSAPAAASSRVTRGLHERFGSERVLDTPISEMGFVGAAVGAAMTGLRPIVEIMFMDFIGVCLDPIVNQAAKLRYMTAGALAGPDRVPHPDGRGAQRRRPALAEPRGDARPRPRAEGRDARRPSPTPMTCCVAAVARSRTRSCSSRTAGSTACAGRARRGDPLPLGQARVAARGRRRHGRDLGPDARASASTPPSRATPSVEVIDLRSLVPLDMRDRARHRSERTGRC